MYLSFHGLHRIPFVNVNGVVLELAACKILRQRRVKKMASSAGQLVVELRMGKGESRGLVGNLIQHAWGFVLTARARVSRTLCLSLVQQREARLVFTRPCFNLVSSIRRFQILSKQALTQAVRIGTK